MAWLTVSLTRSSRLPTYILALAATCAMCLLPSTAMAYKAKVYLSPANHGGNNRGCYGVNEDSHTKRFALEAAAHLRKAGYSVRVGSKTFKPNTQDSNAWRAHAHIPIHSNGGPGLGPLSRNCWGNKEAFFGGTEAYYETRKDNSASWFLARELKTRIGPASPGTTDLFERRNELYELTQTKAYAGYLELERHTWNGGAAWLRDRSHLSAYRMVSVIDRLFAYYPVIYVI